MRYVSRISIVGLLFISIILSVASISIAQQKTDEKSTGYRVSPVRVQKTISPGQSLTTDIYVQNLANTTTINKAKIVNFTADKDESQNAALVEAENLAKFNITNDFNSLVVAIPDFTLEPNEQKIIPVTLSVPKNAKAGGYYGAVTFIPIEKATGNNISVKASVGTLFVITVPGNLTEALSLTEFTTAKNGSTGRLFTNGNNLQIITRLKNTGNIHAQPFGKIQVTDSKGKVVQEVELNNTDPRGNVLPNSTRKFTNDLKNQKMLGKYNISASIAYGAGGGNIITAKNTFWVIPIWMIIAIIAMLTVITIVILMIVRKTMKTKNRRKKHIQS